MEVILGVTSSVVGHIASVQNGAQSHLSESQFPTTSEGVFTRVRNPELTASLIGRSASVFVFSFIKREETKKSDLDQDLDQAKSSHPAVRIFQFGSALGEHLLQHIVARQQLLTVERKY
jgi:hypothetical protein